MFYCFSRWDLAVPHGLTEMPEDGMNVSEKPPRNNLFSSLQIIKILYKSINICMNNTWNLHIFFMTHFPHFGSRTGRSRNWCSISSVAHVPPLPLYKLQLVHSLVNATKGPIGEVLPWLWSVCFLTSPHIHRTTSRNSFWFVAAVH